MGDVDDDVVPKRVYTNFDDYEEDVIAEILARLPVKDLVRFRCVCKSWRALISKSYFVRKHLSYGERGINESSRKLIFMLYPPLALDCDAFKTTEDYEALESKKIYTPCDDDGDGDGDGGDGGDGDGGQFAVSPLDFPVKKTFCDFRFRVIVGACNGLVCVEVNFDDIMLWNHCTTKSKAIMLMNHCTTDSKAMILWNPCTRDFTVLPNPPHLMDSKFSYYLYGLGYDYANDDYKVIRGFICKSDDGPEEIMIHIFSLRTGSWRTVKDIGYVKLKTWQGLFVNGSLHWLYALPEGASRILSFDLGKEEFQKSTIQLPYDGVFSYPFIHRNCLCVCTNPTEANSINIWMMKEYGVKESWTIVQVSLDNCPLDPDFRECLRPLCLLEKGVVLIDAMGSCEHLEVLFSKVKGKPFTHFVEIAVADYFATVIYRETLVSPNFHT